jgi:hypothetical protein
MVGTGEPITVDVCAAAGPDVISRLLELGLGQQFAVITPCNPLGVRLNDDANAVRLAAFRADLDTAGIRSLEADGWSPDRSHVERGNACALSLPAAIALARRWQQLALFWFDGRAFTVIPISGN